MRGSESERDREMERESVCVRVRKIPIISDYMIISLPCSPENTSLKGPVKASPAATSSSSISSS